MKRQRGYLLFEAMISGAILALVLATSLSLVASSRANASYSARRQAAVGLARATLDRLQSAPTIAPGTTALAVVDAANAPGIRVATSIVEVTATYNGNSGASGIDGQLFEIVVTVEHPTARGAETFSLRSLRRVR
jgi:hypothetical protein